MTETVIETQEWHPTQESARAAAIAWLMAHGGEWGHQIERLRCT